MRTLGNKVAARNAAASAAVPVMPASGAVPEDLAAVKAIAVGIGSAPLEADIRSGTSDVYRHEMPGG